MAIAALYDIHGNLPALEAVLREVQAIGVDQVLVGGDVVPGPMPRETLARLLDLEVPVHYLRGNGELAVLAELDGSDVGAAPEPFRDVTRWVAGQLRDTEVALLRSWPQTVRLEAGELGSVLFCHATPRNETEIFTVLTPEEALRPVFADLSGSLVVCGHTHMQFDRTVGGTRVVNAGSVGMPFGEPGAYWLLLDDVVEIRRTDYDLGAAAVEISATGYPGAEDFATNQVLRPPAEAEMLEAFSRVELRPSGEMKADRQASREETP